MSRKIILFFVFFFISLNANSKSYRIGDKITGNLEFYKKYVFNLPDGEWVVADKYAYSYYGIVSKGYILLKIKKFSLETNDTISSLDEINFLFF